MNNLSNEIVSTETIQLCIDRPLDNWLSRSAIMEVMKELLARREAECVPVAWMVGDATLYNPDTVEAYVKRSGLPVIPLFAGAPLPVVPDEMTITQASRQHSGTKEMIVSFADGYNACIAEILASGNSPVTPDGWTGNDAANSALVMLGRIDTLDSADDARIEEIGRIIRSLVATPKPQ